MRQKFTVITLSVLVILNMMPLGIANAQLDPVCSSTPNAAACRDNAQTSGRGAGLYGPGGLLTNIAQLLAVVAGVSAVFLIMLAGFHYITSAGDPNKVQNARDTILFALVGVVIAAIAQSIVLFVLNRLPG